MRANVKLTLMVSVPLHSGTLEEAVAEAKLLKERNVLKFKPNVSYEDGNIQVVGVDSGEWLDRD